MIRVLQVITSMNLGGMESIIMNINRKLDHQKVVFDFLLFDTGNKQYYEDEIKSYGGKIYKVTPRKSSIFKNKKEMNDFFRNNHYDIIHIHQGITYLLPLKLAKKYGIKNRIIHSHGVDGKYKKGLFNIIRKKIILPYINSLANIRFACSNLILNELFTDKVIENKDYKIINNCIDSNKFLYDYKLRNKVRNELDLKDEIVIGHVGRFTNQKNHEFIVNVFKKYNEYNNNSKLLLVGNGYNIDNIKNLVTMLNLEDKVIFYGESDKVNELMQAFDLFIMPSRWEGLPLVTIEAQASGLPLLVSEAISKEANITGNVNYLSLSDSYEIWANKIDEILKNYKRENTYDLIVKGNYDSTVEVKKLEEFYINLK